MNIQELKLDIAQRASNLLNKNVTLSKLVMVRQLKEGTEEKDEWLSHWDNDNRVRITMHENIFNQLSKDPKMIGLAAKMEKVAAKAPTEANPKGVEEYTRFVIITPTGIEGEF